MFNERDALWVKVLSVMYGELRGSLIDEQHLKGSLWWRDVTKVTLASSVDNWFEDNISCKLC